MLPRLKEQYENKIISEIQKEDMHLLEIELLLV